MRTLLTFVAAAGLCSAASGQYYGGDPDGVNGLVNNENMYGFGTYARTYENFNWAGGNVDSLFSNNIDFGGGGAAGSFWEIRSGAGPGNPGSLVASSNTVGGVASYNPTPFNFQGSPINQIFVDVNDFYLAPGSYHFCVSPGDGGTGFGYTYCATTGGANAIGSPIMDNQTILDWPVQGYNFADALSNTGVANLSMGINAAVPAPGAAALLGLSGLVAGRRRRA